jgi:hypothetical protein
MVIDYPENGTRELLHKKEIQDSVDLWAGTPLTYIHPENERKTADDPEAYTGEVIGQVFKPDIVDGEKLKVQAWLDVEKAHDLGGLAADVVEQLRAGDELSVSAGYATFDDDFDGGTHDGDTYNLRQGTLLPDHVAIFPSDEFKARCDWEDGCGAPRANAIETVRNAEVSDAGRFDNPQDALDRATELGCEGVHWHEDERTGEVEFMPCQNHKQWEQATGRANFEVGEFVRLPNGSEPYGRVVEIVENGTRQCGSRVLQTNSDSDDIVMVAVDDFDRPVAHYESSLDAWDTEEHNVNGNESTETGASKTNLREGQYVKWDWGGGTGHGQVVEKVTEPDTCRTVSGNERCASEDRNVLVIGHISSDGEDENQRVVKYEDNVNDWDAPSTADSVNYNYSENALLNHDLCPVSLDDDEITRLNQVANAEVNGEDIDLTPPQSVQDVAQDFLDAHDEGIVGDSCGTNDTSSTGYERAEQLASGDELDVEDIMAAGSGMYGWFARHGEQGNGEVDMREHDSDEMSEREFKYNDCGYAAWRAWGGDEAQEWAEGRHDAITDTRENTTNMMWSDGDMVEFQHFDAVGVVVHNPENPDVVMVEKLRIDGDSIARTGRTVTAGPSDLIPYDGPSLTDNDDPETLFRRLGQKLGLIDNASSSGDDAAPAELDGGDDAEESAEAQQTTNATDSNMSDDDTQSDSDLTLNATLDHAQIAKHTIFTEEMLGGMDEEMVSTIEDQLLLELVEEPSNAEHGEDKEEDYEMTENTTDEQTDGDSQYVTEDELDERMNSLEESITETVEDAIESQRTNHEKEEKARRVANAIDGMSKEAAEELPDEELDNLVEQHATRSNYAGVPGEVDRTPDRPDADADLDGVPAGGRSNYEKRKESGD